MCGMGLGEKCGRRGPAHRVGRMCGAGLGDGAPALLPMTVTIGNPVTEYYMELLIPRELLHMTELFRPHMQLLSRNSVVT